MGPAELQAHCLSRPGAWPDNPWDHEHPVIKVGSVGVKAGAGRDEADEWLARYPDDAAVMAYIGRSGWNTLVVGGAIPDDEVLEAVDESYRRVVAKLPRAHRPDGWEDV